MEQNNETPPAVAEEEYDGGAVPPQKAQELGLTGPFHRFGDGSVIPLENHEENVRFVEEQQQKK